MFCYDFLLMWCAHLISSPCELCSGIRYHIRKKREDEIERKIWIGMELEKKSCSVECTGNIIYSFFYFYTFHPCLRQKKKQPAERKMYRSCDWNKNFIFYCRHYYYYYYYIGVPPTKKELYITYIPLRCLCKMQ